MSCPSCGRHSVLCGGCGHYLRHCTCLGRLITVNVLKDLLALISLDVPASVIAKWGQKTRQEVELYAVKVHLRASDNIVRIPAKPKVLLSKKIKQIGLTGPSVMDMGVK